jgi:hypothetical protein
MSFTTPYRLDGLAPFLAQPAVSGPVQPVDHLLTFHGLGTIFPRRGQQGCPALPLKLGKQRVIIGFAIHDHCLDHASQMSSFPPQAFGFVGAVTDVLEGPQQTRAVRHQAERAMAVHPPVTVTFTPSRFLGQSPQARWEDPWRFLLRVPDRAPCPVHHRIATDHLT